MKIFIDPGHGGSDPGAVSTVKEKDLNLSVGLHLLKQLKHNGFDVQCSRTDDTYLSLDQRVIMANAYGADLFISVHHNAGKGDGFELIHTIHTLYSKGDEFANIIGQEFLKTGQNLRGIYSRESEVNPGQDYYYVIKYTNMPAVITEYAFIDNTADLAQIDELHEQKAEANAIAKAVCKLYGVEFRDVETANTELEYAKKEITYLTQQLKLKDEMLQNIKNITDTWRKEPII